MRYHSCVGRLIYVDKNGNQQDAKLGMIIEFNNLEYVLCGWDGITETVYIACGPFYENGRAEKFGLMWHTRIFE